MARITPSRKSMHGIMKNSGFGDLTIYTPDGVIVKIPKEHITKEGYIKNNIAKYCQVLTRENVEHLESKGVQIFVGKRS